MSEEKQIKRYLLFAGKNEHPRGGWSDLYGSYDTVAAAHGMMHSIGAEPFDWFQIVDVQTGKVFVPAAPEYMR